MFNKIFSQVLLSTAYLPNIQYLSKVIGAEQVVIESQEHYLKQSFRNRCEVLTTNGVLPLTIPVERTLQGKIPIKEIRIDYQQDWQTLHWRTMETAYRSSPFFEYYSDDLKEFYQTQEKFLFDFNAKLLSKVLELIGIRPTIQYTTKYEAVVEHGVDYRNSISPKSRLQQADPFFTPTPYYQVFREKMDFQPNLSILDLLCNEGNNTLSVLLKGQNSQ